MDLQSILIGGVIFLAALGVVFFNDLLKKGDSKPPSKPKEPGSTLGLIIGILVAAGALILPITFPQAVSLWWTIPLGIIAVFLAILLFALRRLIWIYVKALLTGSSFPTFIRTTEDGAMHMKCPRCATRVEVTPGKKGDPAFECENCGESARWDSEMNFTQGDGNQPDGSDFPPVTIQDETSQSAEARPMNPPRSIPRQT